MPAQPPDPADPVHFDSQFADIDPAVEAADEPFFAEYLRAVYKHRRLAVTVFTVIFLGTVVHTFTATRIFEARVKLLIEADNPNIVSFEEVIEETRGRADYYVTQYDILRSRSLARRTLDALDLWTHREFGGVSEEPSYGPGQLLSAVVSRLAGLFRAAEETPRSMDEAARQARAIDSFAAQLAVSPVDDSRVVNVGFRSRDPVLATNVVNAFARAYIEQNLEFRFLASEEAADWLSDRLKEQRERVEASELALQRYREENDAISLEDQQNIVVQGLADLNEAVTRARTERIEKEALYAQVRAVEAGPERLDTFPAILSNVFIQQLKTELAGLERQENDLERNLGERHPDMIKIRSTVEIVRARIDGEIGKVVQSVRNEFVAAQAQERSLVAALETQKNEALRMNRKGIEYGVLRRDAESNQHIYQTLLQRANEMSISSELRTSNIRVVDAAEVPRAPVSPNVRRNVLLGGFGGVVLAICLALFFEFADNRIRSPHEIKAHLGLPFLGMIPEVPVTVPSQQLMVTDGAPSDFSESFRGVRTNILFSSAEGESRTLVVTSTGPDEGKTVIASNLAIGIAQAGQRVLLIDADMRRSKIHDLFDVPKEPGLSNFIVGSAKASDVMHESKVKRLWVLPAGRLPPNPAELLGSRRFIDLMLKITEHFDWVLVDSPPVMAVTDASVVAHIVKGVVFVVGAERTSRRAASAAVEQLERAGGRFIGAVLNRVDLARNGYYYNQYYRPEYRQYYADSKSTA